MSDWTLTKIRLFEGIWEGALTGALNAGAQPRISVTHLDKPVEGIELIEDTPGQRWILRFPIPPQAVADGVQTLLVSDSATGTLLEKITLMSGEPLSEDIRAELDLLRAELDMLKRAFRRHCLETMSAD